MRFRLAMLCVVSVLSSTPAWGDALSPDQRASEARQCRKRGEEVLLGYDQLLSRCDVYAGFTRDDLKAAKPAFDAEAALWKRAGDAMESGDAAAWQSLKDQATAAAATVATWRERLEVRLKEGEVAPLESHFNNMRPEAGTEAYGALAALYEARRGAADAWCVLAEQVVPGADPAKLTDLREQAMRATDVADVAAKGFEDALRRARLAPKKAELPEAVVPLLEALRKLDEQRDAMRREDLERAARGREIDRKREALEKQIRDARASAGKGAK